MKKFICMLLAILSVLSLCACGEGPVNSAGVPMATKEPTEEERELIVDYYCAVRELEETTHAPRMAELYHELQAMEAYDKYTGTEYASCQYLKQSSGKLFTTSYDREISSWDRKEVLSRFTVLEDLLVSVQKTTTDQVGNVSGPYDLATWYYNPDGTILSIRDEGDLSPIDLNGYNDSFLDQRNGQREYDENGRLVKINYLSQYGDIEMVSTFTYDANGNLLEQEAKNNYQQRLYTYKTDSQGRVTSITWQDGFKQNYEIVYTYDANGNLTGEVKSQYNEKDVLEAIWSFTHSYDANGHRTESVYLWEDYEDTHWSLDPNFVSDRYTQRSKENTYSYECDEAGRISRVTETFGTNFLYDIDGTVKQQYDDSTVTVVYEPVYDVFCFYNQPENNA